MLLLLMPIYVCCLVALFVVASVVADWCCCYLFVTLCVALLDTTVRRDHDVPVARCSFLLLCLYIPSSRSCVVDAIVVTVRSIPHRTFTIVDYRFYLLYRCGLDTRCRDFTALILFLILYVHYDSLPVTLRCSLIPTATLFHYHTLRYFYSLLFYPYVPNSVALRLRLFTRCDLDTTFTFWLVCTLVTVGWFCLR